jgi:acyl-ACP thioesterase
MCVTRIEYQVKSFDCQPDGRMKYASLMQLLQEAAHVSAENLGFGFERLKATGRVWVLSNFKIAFQSVPAWMDLILVETWPGTFNRLVATREFLVKNAQQEIIAAATSEWFTIDVTTRKLLGLDEIGKTLVSHSEKALNEPLKRLNPKKFPDGRKIGEIIVPYSATDLNGHVNNAEYIRWSFDGLRRAQQNPPRVSAFQISFLAESFENDPIEFLMTTTEANRLLVWGVHTQTRDALYAMEIEN